MSPAQTKKKAAPRRRPSPKQVSLYKTGLGPLHRGDRLPLLLQEDILRETKRIDTGGTKVGQVIDIEREIELAGAIHSKGVLTLSSFLATRYASNMPLSLSASLAFEQTYGMVEGDSASMAELCALLSAIADVPINQSRAITGSVVCLASAVSRQGHIVAPPEKKYEHEKMTASIFD